MKNYFAHYAPVIMDLLGIKAWTKDSNQKDSLLEEQKQKLKALSFDENFITGFCEILPQTTGIRIRKVALPMPISPMP